MKYWHRGHQIELTILRTLYSCGRLKAQRRSSEGLSLVTSGVFSSLHTRLYLTESYCFSKCGR